MATLQSVHVQPGRIQWPQLNLPNMADLHLGSAEAGEIVQQEGNLEQNLVQNVEEVEKEGYQEGNQEVNQEVKREQEPLNGCLGSRVAAALSFHRNSARKDEEEEEETVKIVEVCSPWKIQVVSSRHWTIWEMLRQAVAREGESAKFRRKKTVSKGDKALLYINKRWERVIIKKVGEGSQTKVKLIDVGSSVEIPTGDLREMSVELQRSPCFTKAISLAGVKCGPDETWKIAITEKLREILPVNKILSFKRLRQGGVLGDLFIEKTDEDQKIVKVSVTQILTELSIFIPPTSPIVQEESNNNLINKNNTRGEKTVEMYRQKTSPIRKSKLRPMLTPLLPGSGFFRAKIVHIDRRGVVWVLPNDHIRLLAEVTAEISICTDVSEESQVDVGNLLVCQTGRTVVRGRILEVKEGGVVFLDVDTGETGQCELQKVFAITPNLLSISPLAIPIWLYGLEQTRNLLDGRVVARLLETIPRAQVTVSLLEPGLTSSFPLLANVRYSGRSQAELESNLALTLLEWGLMSVETSHRQRQLSGLGWLNLSSSLPPPLYNPPHPFPLAEGLWLSVTVQGIYFPLDEEQPTIECPHANRVSCHLVPLSSDRNFGFCHREITSSAKVSKNPLKALEISYEDLRVKLAADAEQGEGVKAVSPGDGVIVLVGQEWCRATVLRQLRNQVVQVSYTDYGHNGEAHIKDLRTMKEKRRLEPVQVREFSYQMPESNEVRGLSFY